ncbi:MAG: DUF397 domain-containing protein [Candidatus Dormibacteraceae bacterium]
MNMSERAAMVWRKSSYSGTNSECVEIGFSWRKSSYSGTNSNCVELAPGGAIRDSKNPNGPTLTANIPALLNLLKSHHLPG